MLQKEYGLCFNKNIVSKISEIFIEPVEFWAINNLLMKVEKRFGDGYVNLNSADMLHRSILVERMLSPYILCEITNDATFALEFSIALGEKQNYCLNRDNIKSAVFKGINQYSFFDKSIANDHFVAESYFCTLMIMHYVSLRLSNLHIFESITKEFKSRALLSPLMNLSHAYFFKKYYSSNVVSRDLSCDDFFENLKIALLELSEKFENNLIQNYKHFHFISGEQRLQ